MKLLVDNLSRAYGPDVLEKPLGEVVALVSRRKPVVGAYTVPVQMTEGEASVAMQIHPLCDSAYTGTIQLVVATL